MARATIYVCDGCGKGETESKGKPMPFTLQADENGKFESAYDCHPVTQCHALYWRKQYHAEKRMEDANPPTEKAK